MSYHSTVRRRRSIIKILALLAAGATFNVAVAWGLASYGPLAEPTWDMDWHDDHVAWWIASRPGGVGCVPKVGPTPRGSDSVMRSRSVGLESLDISVVSTEPLFEFARVCRVRSGWPCFSMQGAVWHFGIKPKLQVFTNAVAIHIVPQNLAPEMQFPFPDRLLPLRALWPDFAINTLFYAGVVWMMLAGPFALRRMTRRRRGRCPACNYPIGQGPVCTECGAAITQASRDQGIEASRG